MGLQYGYWFWSLDQLIIYFQIISVISIAFVVASTIGMTMNTISSIQHRNINNEPIDNPKLALIEAICISWFTIEYLLRLAGIYSEHHWPSPLYAHFRRLLVFSISFTETEKIADTKVAWVTWHKGVLLVNLVHKVALLVKPCYKVFQAILGWY